jgi:hypothetical protein
MITILNIGVTIMPETHRWYPVRCCCTPTKIFGFMKLKITYRGPLVVRDNIGTRHKIEIRLISTMRTGPSLDFDKGPIAEMTSMQREDELAIYSDDRPIEFWRNIPDFLELK